MVAIAVLGSMPRNIQAAPFEMRDAQWSRPAKALGAVFRSW
jgi:hypothetical protein